MKKTHDTYTIYIITKLWKDQSIEIRVFRQTNLAFAERPFLAEKKLYKGYIRPPEMQFLTGQIDQDILTSAKRI